MTNHTVYRYHNCPSRHRTWRALAKCIWGDRFVEFDSPWFAVESGGRVTMHPSEESASLVLGARVVRIADNCEPRTYEEQGIRHDMPIPQWTGQPIEAQPKKTNHVGVIAGSLILVFLVCMVLAAIFGEPA